MRNFGIAPRAYPGIVVAVIFGWVLVGHQAGAALAAFGTGIVREISGSYDLAFLIAGAFGIAAAIAVLNARGATPQSAAAATAPAA